MSKRETSKQRDLKNRRRGVRLPTTEVRDWAETYAIRARDFAVSDPSAYRTAARILKGNYAVDEASLSRFLTQVDTLIEERRQNQYLDNPEPIPIRPNFLHALVTSAKPQLLQRSRGMSATAASEIMIETILASGISRPFYISAYHLKNAEPMLKALTGEPAISRIIIRRMSAHTRRVLSDFLPPGLEADYQRRLARIRKINYASARGFVNDELYPWERIPPLHGMLYGDIMNWGRWEVDDAGRLTVENAEMYILTRQSNQQLFGHLKALMTDHGRLDTSA